MDAEKIIPIEDTQVTAKKNETPKLITYPLGEDGSITINAEALATITVGEVRSKSASKLVDQLARVVEKSPAAWGDLETADEWNDLPLKKLGLARAALNATAENVKNVKGWTYDIADSITMREVEALQTAFATNDIDGLIAVAVKFAVGAPGGINPNDPTAYNDLSYYGVFMPLIQGMYRVASAALKDFLATSLPAL